MKILIVKLSSLGDVVHTMPAVQDIRRCVPQASIDWVVERGFAPLVARCEGAAEAIPCELRRWSRNPLSHETRAEWRTFRQRLRSVRYDAVIDLQGLTKSALVARAARTTEGGKRFAMANRTDGASYEAPTRWVADVAIKLEPRVHAVQRAREICARALGYDIPSPLRFGLRASAAGRTNAVCLVHGTSRDDKCWPAANWLALGRRLIAQGHTLALPHGNDEELARSEAMARELGDAAQVWPRLDLGALTDRLATCAGVIGVDSGLSHIAVALDLPHVQVYNFETAWRTGPFDTPHQRAVYAQPTPSLEAVWDAWESVRPRP
ncbi:lipopolysaccharide heptosyltransferase I [Ramlibacter sp. PS4R-6]|uniref:lipopolysaccharide heptosyltransferase I n=1 Tax=Ramlibacter sp. PS4R-6 TaxID=3133438 RepID=UPI0030AFAEB6